MAQCVTGCSLSITWKVANNETDRAKHGITVVKHVLFCLAKSRHNGQLSPNESKQTVPDVDIFSMTWLTLTSNNVNTPGNELTS